MPPFDTVFLALAATCFAPRPGRWWLVSAAPVISFAVRLAPMHEYHILALALIALALSAKWSPAALLLVAPMYEDLLQALFVAVLWTTIVVLIDTLEERLDDEHIPSRIRGAPVRLVTLGVIYFTLSPLAFV